MAAAALSANNAPTRRQQKPSHATDILEKDETELRLERALFGDEAGFLESLTTARHDENRALQVYGSDSDAAGDDSTSENLEDVPDEDVGPLL